MRISDWSSDVCSSDLKAGNVTKRFNATSFHIAEYGGACPVWNIHTSFRTPGVIVPQFVELPDGDRFFTISRTTERPVFSRDTQDRSEEHTSELQSLMRISYAVFCLKKKKENKKQ